MPSLPLVSCECSSIAGLLLRLISGLGQSWVGVMYVCARFSCVWLCATLQTVAHLVCCPWDFPGKNTGMGCHFLLQGIFQTQRSNPSLLHLLHWQAVLYHQHHLGSPGVMWDWTLSPAWALPISPMLATVSRTSGSFKGTKVAQTPHCAPVASNHCTWGSYM